MGFSVFCSAQLLNLNLSREPFTPTLKVLVSLMVKVPPELALSLPQSQAGWVARPALHRPGRSQPAPRAFGRVPTEAGRSKAASRLEGTLRKWEDQVGWGRGSGSRSREACEGRGEHFLLARGGSWVSIARGTRRRPPNVSPEYRPPNTALEQHKSGALEPQTGWATRLPSLPSLPGFLLSCRATTYRTSPAVPFVPITGQCGPVAVLLNGRG